MGESTRCLRWAALASIACAPTAPVPVGPAPASPVATGPMCNPVGAGEILARVEADPCPQILLRVAEGVQLVSLSPGSDGALATGELPMACDRDRCHLDATLTASGAMFVAVVRSATSEMPAGVHLGVVVGGERVEWIDLWLGAGVPVVGDGTDLGPAFSLVPHSCTGGVGLFVGGRLPAAAGLGPPPELLAREGIYDLGNSALERVKGSKDGCAAIELPLP